MLPKNRMRVVVLLIGLMALMVGVSLAERRTAAQAQESSLRALLETVNASGATVTVLVDKPFLAGETLLTLPDTALNRSLAEIGEDYLCVSEPWNDGARLHCTPFENIVSVSYVR